jgi:hypothetical protein
LPSATTTIQETADHLPKDLRITLGMLNGPQPELNPEVTDAVLQSLPFGSRCMLVAYGVIHDDPETTLTEFGEKVAWACYRRHQQYVNYRYRELEHARLERDAEQLPADLQELLALYVGQDDSTVELMLTLTPRSKRELLEQHGVIEVKYLSPEADAAFEVLLTDHGRKMIKACHQLQLPEEIKQKVRDLNKALREHYESLD